MRAGEAVAVCVAMAAMAAGARAVAQERGESECAPRAQTPEVAGAWVVCCVPSRAIA